MVCAKLHLICGNCGGDDFEYSCNEEYYDADETLMRVTTSITCLNCSTIHNLDDNADNKNTPK